MYSIMNEITETYLEYKAITSEPISAALLVLADILKAKTIELDRESIEYIVDSLSKD